MSLKLQEDQNKSGKPVSRKRPPGAAFGLSGLPKSRLAGPFQNHGVNAFDHAEVILVKWLLSPVVAVGTFWLSTIAYGQEFNQHYIILAVLAFLVTTHIFDEINLYRSAKRFPLILALNSAVIKWSVVVVVLLLVLYVTKLSALYSRKILLTWFLITPFASVIIQATARKVLGGRLTRQSPRRAVIVGANQLGSELYERITGDAYLGIQIVGYFDDRDSDRLPDDVRDKLLGKISDAAAHVRDIGVEQVYITLPIHLRQRLESLVAELNDTTASVYIVPDVLLFELVQARVDHLNGVPVVAVRDTPFTGLQGIAKRLFDMVFASVAILALLPIFVLIAIGIKLTSPGPAIFKQRRYGLAGEEITVYKFRSMTVCQDGIDVAQAVRHDARVTRLGVFLRRFSLDELPQFINVLQGRMSIVGPRPHAIAHNELYRKAISGYMIRHKVRPGITGWAQINGLRGETDSVDKMRARVDFDIDYIRHWSLAMDLFIIAKTITGVFGDEAAYY